MARSRYLRWTDDEDEIVRRYYPVVGARWRGWHHLLPERELTSDIVAHRAMRLGVRCDSQFRYGKGKRAAQSKAEAMAVMDGHRLEFTRSAE